MLGYAVISLYVIVGMLCYLERYVGKYKLPIYLSAGLIMIILAATKEVGIDPDSEMYEDMFNNFYSSHTADVVEYSFIMLSEFIHMFSDDVHMLFLFYAILGVGLKLIAFRQLCESWFLPLLVYISYYYIFHELMQIRTGVMSGMFLLSIKPMCEGKRLKAFIFLAIGTFFHYSALVLFPLLFLSNKPLSGKGRLAWALVVPIGYFFFFYGFSALLDISTGLPYIGEKLALYQKGTETGVLKIAVNVFNPLYLLTTVLYLYLLYFHDNVIEHNQYFPLLIKIFGLGVLSYTMLSSFPVLAQRINLLLVLVITVLYPNLKNTVRPLWVGTTVVLLVTFAYLNIGLPSIDFSLLWVKTD
jgi:hypothetical protein